jgi:hypothetical protein
MLRGIVKQLNMLSVDNGIGQMSATVISLIISLISGAAGGNIVGTLLKQFNLGPLGNSLAGIIGGGLGGQLLGMLTGGGMATGAPAGADMTGGLDIGTIVSQIAGGGVGGGILMVIVGYIRQMMGGGQTK